MKLTKDQITEKREELCKVLVAMNKQRAKADNIKKDLADFGRPTDERRATEGAGVGRPSRQVRSSERVSSVHRPERLGGPSLNHFRRDPSSVRTSRTGAPP